MSSNCFMAIHYRSKLRGGVKDLVAGGSEGAIQLRNIADQLQRALDCMQVYLLLIYKVLNKSCPIICHDVHMSFG